MNDLISRQAAIDAMKNMYRAAEKWGFEASDDVIKARAESCMASLVEMKLRIENLPSAQERKKGRWKRAYLDHEAMGERPSILYCSVCNQCIAYPVNYCPNCGAQMRDKDER